ARGEVAPLHRGRLRAGAGTGGADLDLDLLGGRLADQDAVVAAHVVDDRVVEAIAADAHRRGVHDAVQRDHRDPRPTRPDEPSTRPSNEITAPSDVPPPMSSTIEPRASCTGKPAPTAAAI